MCIEMSIDPKNDFSPFCRLIAISVSSGELGSSHRSQSQDRTLTVQCKAPIRSLTPGPMTLGERPYRIDRSTQRHSPIPARVRVDQAFKAILD